MHDIVVISEIPYIIKKKISKTFKMCHLGETSSSYFHMISSGFGSKIVYNTKYSAVLSGVMIWLSLVLGLVLVGFR
jgi:hypothetical protein